MGSKTRATGGGRCLEAPDAIAVTEHHSALARRCGRGIEGRDRVREAFRPPRITVRVNRDQMRSVTVEWKLDGILGDRSVRCVENSDAIDVAVVLCKPDQP